MKKCYYFPTWVDISENVCISCDEKSIYVQPNEMFLVRKADKFISLWHDDLVSCDTRYEDDAISNDCLDISKVHHAYTINGFKHEEDSLIPITSNTLEHAKRFTKSTASDPILAKLCELTGAKMYGDYIVLDCFFQKTRFLEHFIGDLCKCVISFIVTKEDKEYICIAKKDNNISNHFGYYTIRKKEQLPILDYMGACDRFEDIIKIYNIFQEYSKFLRNEESRWEEVKKIVL